MGNSPAANSSPPRDPPRQDDANPTPAPFGVPVQLPESQPKDEEYFGPVDEEGRPHGYGTVLYAEQDPGERSKFQGEWVHGKRHGQGILIWRNGSRYDGNFIDDKLGGQGALLWALGLEYRGEWINNYAHGRGELRFPNGKRYFGEWANGKRHGWGHLTFPVNDEKQRVEYVGGWFEDLQSGEGVMKWSNNASYTGHWLQGKRHGYGVHTFPYVLLPFFVSFFPLIPHYTKNGSKHVFGLISSCTLTSSKNRTGEKYEGEWKEGIRHGQGRRHYPDGSVYDGGWSRDKKHGQAKMYLPHGTKICVFFNSSLPSEFDDGPGRIINELWDHGTKLPVPVPQGVLFFFSPPPPNKLTHFPIEPQTLLTLCIEAVASDTWRIHRVAFLPQELREKINHLRVYRTLQRRAAHEP